MEWLNFKCDEWRQRQWSAGENDGLRKHRVMVFSGIYGLLWICNLKMASLIIGDLIILCVYVYALTIKSHLEIYLLRHCLDALEWVSE